MFFVSLFLLLLFVSGIVVFLVWHLLTRNVTQATAHLREMTKSYAAKEEEIKKKLEEAEKQYAEALRRATKEAEILKDKHKKEVEEEKSRVLALANKQSEELLERAQRTCETIKAELEKHINQRAVERAGELICRVLPEETRRSMHEQWVEALIAEGLSGLDRLRIPEGLTKVEVAVAFPLTGEQRKKLDAKLKEKIGMTADIQETVQESLIAGMVVTLENLIFDGSFAAKIREAVREFVVRENV